MQHPFNYYQTINEVQVAHYEGHVTVERCDNDPDDWYISTVELDGLKPGSDGTEIPTTVTAPLTEPLAKEIVLYLYKHEDGAINDAWREHIALCKAERVAV